MSHECPRNGCTRTVDDARLMCGPARSVRRGSAAHCVTLVQPPFTEPKNLGVRAAPIFDGGLLKPGVDLIGKPKDPDEYRFLLREHGHLIGPGDPGYDPDAPRTLPCGWSPGKTRRRAGDE